MKPATKDAYQRQMESSEEQQYQKDQQRLEALKRTKQNLINHRSLAVFGTAQEKNQIERNRREQIEIQKQIKQEITEKEKQQMQQNTGVDSITNMQRESHIDNIYRQQLAKQIQRENQQLAMERMARENKEKEDNQKYNSDRYFDHSKRNQDLY